jgi:hypothetical protein
MDAIVCGNCGFFGHDTDLVNKPVKEVASAKDGEKHFRTVVLKMTKNIEGAFLRVCPRCSCPVIIRKAGADMQHISTDHKVNVPTVFNAQEEPDVEPRVVQPRFVDRGGDDDYQGPEPSLPARRPNATQHKIKCSSCGKQFMSKVQGGSGVGLCCPECLKLRGI